MPSDSLLFSLLTHQHHYTIYTDKITRRCCLLPLPIRRKIEGQTFWGDVELEKAWWTSWAVGASEDGWLSAPDRSNATISVFISCGRRRPKPEKSLLLLFWCAFAKRIFFFFWGRIAGLNHPMRRCRFLGSQLAKNIIFFLIFRSVGFFILFFFLIRPIDSMNDEVEGFGWCCSFVRRQTKIRRWQPLFLFYFVCELSSRREHERDVDRKKKKDITTPFSKRKGRKKKRASPPSVWSTAVYTRQLITFGLLRESPV